MTLVPRREHGAGVRLAIYSRDKYTCHYCGKVGEQLTLDHIVPLSLGGADELDNLITACHSCNSAKGARPITEGPLPSAKLSITVRISLEVYQALKATAETEKSSINAIAAQAITKRVTK